MCVYIYIYIYIYGCAGFCACSWMGGQRGGSYLQHLWSSAEVSRRPSFVYFGTKTTQRAVPAKTWETERQEWRGSSQLGVRPQSGQSRAEKQSVRSMELRHGAMKMTTRWVSIFGSCVGLLQSSHVSQNK